MNLEAPLVVKPSNSDILLLLTILFFFNFKLFILHCGIAKSWTQLSD